jgi:serine/threonine protein kinase/cyclophilin family peptidyl-prolyl cis-trans isomerase
MQTRDPSFKAPESDRLVGRSVGKYRVLERLGAGGMGTVYVAEHALLEQRVALKVISPQLAQMPGMSERFLREARSASRVDHENVIKVTDLGEDDGHLYLAMELLEGGDLASVLAQEGALPWPRARAIALQIAEGLKAAHDKKIVHRDLKPENIFLVRKAGRTDVVKLLDFGIAKVLTETGPKLTQTGFAIGSPLYMAPEQIEATAVDQRTDIYAFGCVLYHMVTGQSPFVGDSIAALYRLHLLATPVAPGVRRPDLAFPEGFDALLLKALAKEREARWQNMDEVLTAIAACDARRKRPVVSETIWLPIAKPSAFASRAPLPSPAAMADPPPRPQGQPTVVRPTGDGSGSTTTTLVPTLAAKIAAIRRRIGDLRSGQKMSFVFLAVFVVSAIITMAVRPDPKDAIDVARETAGPLPVPPLPAPAEPEKPTTPAPTEAPQTPPTEESPKSGWSELRPPISQDIWEYTNDLKGKGPLRALIETSMGTINCELFAEQAPKTVANFVGLSRGLKPFLNPKTGAIEKRPFFDGLIFHRVIPDFMIQTGDPLGQGTGDPGYRFVDEINPSLRHDKGGTLSMANAGPGTNGSQFFITERPTPHLDDRHTVFGACKNLDVIKKIARVEKDPADPVGSRPKVPVVIRTVRIRR